MKLEGRFGVIGNPIQHSLSPQIQQQFAGQFHTTIDYQKYLIEPDNLKGFIQDFFDQQGRGLNVTLPFKQAVIECVDELSDEAKLAGSINTLSFTDGGIVGSTTDGIGLLYDLARLGFEFKNKTLLVVGAGGASQSILVSLLRAGAKIKILNRTHGKVESLVRKLNPIGRIEPYQAGDDFDGLISSISEFNPELMAPLAYKLGGQVFCYDLNYGGRAQAFKDFAVQNGCKNFADGIGMLIGQAAKSFEIWTGQLPKIDKVSIDA